MKLSKKLTFSFMGAILGLATIQFPVQAQQYYFKVQNSSSSTIKALYVSQDKKDWGYFDVGGGIAAGATETLNWDKSTNNEACDQWIEAEFADGSKSESTQFNFCKDMDEPIVFK